MRLIIEGREYPMENGVQRANINDLIDLKLQTGVGLSELGEGLEEIGRIGVEASLDDVKLLGALRAFIFLARRAAGEKVTVKEAVDFPFTEMRFEPDPGDDTPDPDPDVPPDPSTGSAPAGGDVPAVPKRIPTQPSSRTSGKRSKHD